ncbi:Maf family protein [Coralloluteibacterium stylophorae]|uniref:dTTP/UTP pyrophosphatase n=1 Tax=Coralloluteibacterium stylophorae TaxID=1776034 RepID=A0A8J7VW70_9GAMM|nr:Maf family nucleotide pyrophosphatase [Coralloluteibacterium stylophorae]MBS7456242.1 septum formation inhibitor Maf [Coralloluteibacterium stylophorae]
MLRLASKSPRRRELLAQLAVDFEVIDVDVPEVRAAAEPPRDYVLRVAADKAAAGLAAAGGAGWCLGSDTEVVLEDRVFGKPADAGEAAAMLAALAGRTHQVLSSVWLVSPTRRLQALCESRVRFDAVTDARIADYLACGEWRGKAGGYAIQGRAAAFVAHLDGSYSGVMGLPLFETAALLREAGLLPAASNGQGA